MTHVTRANLLEVYMHAYATGHVRNLVERRFRDYEESQFRALGKGIGGAATPITTLRTRWTDESVVTGTAESEELDFNIALRQGIEIYKIACRIQAGAATATNQFMHALVDLDGPALAGNKISSLALYDARSVLESCIANFGIGGDLLTSGGFKTEELQQEWFVIPILTARNIGVARNSLTSSGRALVGIQHRFVEITRDENIMLFALGRA